MLIKRLSILVLVFGLYACTPKNLMSVGTHIKVKQAYLQKTYPGVEGMKIQDDLFIQLQPYSKDITPDSLYYNGKVYVLPTPSERYAIDLTAGKPIINTNYQTTTKDSATLFYNQNDKAHYYKFGGIVKKESLYMP